MADHFPEVACKFTVPDFLRRRSPDEVQAAHDQAVAAVRERLAATMQAIEVGVRYEVRLDCLTEPHPAQRATDYLYLGSVDVIKEPVTA